MGLSRGESRSKPREIVFPSRFFLLATFFFSRKESAPFLVLLLLLHDIRGDGAGKSGTRGREKDGNNWFTR